MKANLLDNVIGYISPKAGYSRLAWRESLEIRSNYDAATSDRLQGRWTRLNASAELTDRVDRDTIRARARDLERNSDLQNSALRAFRRNVIGSGINVQVTTKDQSLNTTIEKLWKKWCKARNCDVTGTQSLSAIMRMCMQRKIVDGGFLILKIYTDQGFLPFQLQVLEVDDLDNNQFKAKHKGNRVIGGIEFNRYNRAQGYWIKQYSVDGLQYEPSVYVEAENVIFYYTKKRPTQIREMSDMAPTLTRVKDVNEFMNAVTVKEKIAACFAAFIKRINPANGFGSTRNNINKGTEEISYEGKRIVPGMMFELNPGEDVEFSNPSGQSTDASAFIKLQEKMIGAGHGLSYEAISRDLSDTTYSSARQGLIEDDLTYDEEREGIEQQVLDEIYETFIISCFLHGDLDVPDFWENKEDYMSHEWITQPRRWIDPYKEANANAIALKTGQKTFQQLQKESGRDWKQVVDEIAEFKQYTEQQGINLDEAIYSSQIGELESAALLNDKE